MNLLKKLSALALALALCFTAVLSAAAEGADTLLATVNGVPVTTSVVEAQISYLNEYFTNQNIDVTLEANVKAIRNMALESVVQTAMMQLKAAELGLDQVSDDELAAITAEVDNQWNEAVDNIASIYFGASETASEEVNNNARLQAIAMLESYGLTQEMLLEETLNDLWFEKLQAMIVQDVLVTDADVEAAYAEMVASEQANLGSDIETYELYTQYLGYEFHYMPEGYRGVRHILLNVDEALMENYSTLAAKLEEQIEALETGAETEASEDAVTQADVDAAAAAIIASVQPTIDEINQKLADGVSFTDLIAAYGNDPGMTQEPQKTDGYNVHMNSVLWDPAFTKGAFTIDQVGGVSEPIVSSFGVHILEYTRDVPSGAVPMSDDVAASIKAELIANAEADLVNATIEAWLAEAEIIYMPEADAYRAEEKK